MRSIVLILVVFSSLTSTSNSQSLDSLITGRKYRITLFDEREFTGTIVSQNEKSISLNTGRTLMTIEKENILSFSKDISPSKYKFLATLSYGIVPNDYHDNGYTSNFIINGRFSYFYSDSKNIGGDLSYIFFNRNNYYEYGGTSVTGGDEHYIDLLANLQIGTFNKNNIIDVYLNLGAGMHIYHMNSSFYSYYSIYGLGYYTSERMSFTDFYPMIQIGGGLLIKPTYNIGINLELDIKAFGFGYLVFPSEAYIPVKAGLSYYFMKPN